MPLKDDKLNQALLAAIGPDAAHPAGDYTTLPDQFRPIFDAWPPALKHFADTIIYRVLIVSDLPSSGRILTIEGSDKFVVLIDERTLAMSANDWATQSEETSFHYQDERQRLRVEIEGNDDPILTFENILIHELGHAFGRTLGITPDFDYTLDQNTYPFFENTFISTVEFERKHSEDLVYNNIIYYGEAQEVLDFEGYYHLVEDLENTSYPTIYSSRNPLEFFADTFYSYVHCVLQSKPYEFIITDSGGSVRKVSNGIYIAFGTSEAQGQDPYYNAYNSIDSPWFVAFADLNMDSIPDMVGVDGNSNSKIDILKGTTSDSYSHQTSYQGKPGEYYNVMLADLNKDGIPTL